MKSRLLSKTYIFNFLVVLLASLEAYSSVIRDLFPNFYAYFILFVGVSNMVLREMTKEKLAPLKTKKKENDIQNPYL